MSEVLFERHVKSTVGLLVY